MKRYMYDLDCYRATAGMIGRLQTLHMEPMVVPNQSIGLDIQMAIRLEAMNQPVQLDVKVDVYTFAVKHRHLYGDIWVDFIKEGLGSTTAATTINGMAHTLTGGSYGYLQVPDMGTGSVVVPYFYHAGYARIWNEYFRVPNVTKEQAASYLQESIDEDTPFDGTYDPASAQFYSQRFGHVTARLPALWTTGVYEDTTASTRYVDATSGGGTDVVLTEIAQAQALFSSEAERNWLSPRYRDLLNTAFGAKGHVAEDIDNRPELCAHTELWMGGYDMPKYDGYGSLVGRQEAIINHHMSMKYFQEHCSLWTLIVLRFPSILAGGAHYLCNNDLSYENCSGDPRVFATQPPIEIDEDDIIGNGGSGTFGIHPYGQWMRFGQDWVHPLFGYSGYNGWPFVDISQFTTAPNLIEAVYCQNTNMDYFQTTTYGHYKVLAKCNVPTKSPVPPSAESIFAGNNFHAADK